MCAAQAAAQGAVLPAAQAAGQTGSMVAALPLHEGQSRQAASVAPERLARRQPPCFPSRIRQTACAAARRSRRRRAAQRCCARCTCKGARGVTSELQSSSQLQSHLSHICLLRPLLPPAPCWCSDLPVISAGHDSCTQVPQHLHNIWLPGTHHGSTYRRLERRARLRRVGCARASSQDLGICRDTLALSFHALQGRVQMTNCNITSAFGSSLGHHLLEIC